MSGDGGKWPEKTVLDTSAGTETATQAGSQLDDTKAMESTALANEEETVAAAEPPPPAIEVRRVTPMAPLPPEPPIDDDSPARPASRLGWFVVLLLLAAAGFGVFQLYLPLQAELTQANARVDELQKEDGEQTAELESLRSEMATMREAHEELAVEAEARAERLAQVKKTSERLRDQLKDEIKKGTILVREVRGELVVDLVDKIMFDPGTAELNERGKEVLLQVGATLRDVPDKIIQVGGHTDNVPITGELLEKFSSNWDLSAQRATNVALFLHEEVKVPGPRLVAVGFGPYRPAASNKTKRGRRRNRRIELTLVPKLPTGRRSRR